MAYDSGYAQVLFTGGVMRVVGPLPSERPAAGCRAGGGGPEAAAAAHGQLLPQPRHGSQA